FKCTPTPTIYTLSYTTLFRSDAAQSNGPGDIFLKFFNAPIDQIFEKYSDLTGRTVLRPASLQASITIINYTPLTRTEAIQALDGDRKSTRLNSSHDQISYAVF